MNIKGTDLTSSIDGESSYTTIANNIDTEIEEDHSYAGALGGSISGIINLDIFSRNIGNASVAVNAVLRCSLPHGTVGWSSPVASPPGES